MTAADILQSAGAALPTAIFQSIDLREPPRTSSSAFMREIRLRAPLPSISARQEELQVDRQPDRRHIHAADVIGERWPAWAHHCRGLDARLCRGDAGGAQCACPARPRHARKAPQRPGHSAHARLVRTSGGIAPDREGADVLHRLRGNQPVRETDRRPPGHHRPRRPGRFAGDRHRTVAAAGVRTQFRRGIGRGSARRCARAESHSHHAAARHQYQHERQRRRLAEMEVPRALRTPGRTGSRWRPTTGVRSSTDRWRKSVPYQIPT